MTTRKRRSAEEITQDLITEGAAVLVDIVRSEMKLTERYKALALIIIDLRARYKDADGAPDWRGRTQAYREAAAAMYEQAGVPADSAGSVQATIRYHVGNALRERLAPKDLVAVGLKEAGPKDRASERRIPAAQVEAARHHEGFTPTQDQALAMLREAAQANPELVVLDLAEPTPDVVSLVKSALNTIKRARDVGADNGETAAAVRTCLDEIIVEVSLLRVEVTHPEHEDAAA